MTPSQDEDVRYLAELLGGAGLQLAVAESLTGGMLSAGVAKGPGASTWFKGGVVAYQATVKRSLLGVGEGPVVSELCAVQMARGVARLMGADLGLGITGVGGPEPEEGQPAGTVWAAARTARREVAQLAHFTDRAPADVCSASCDLAIRLAIRVLEEG